MYSRTKWRCCLLMAFPFFESFYKNEIKKSNNIVNKRDLLKLWKKSSIIILRRRYK